MASALHDLRVGLRLLLKNRTFAITAVATLAVCIGANAALFAVVHAVVLQPLPFKNPARLVVLGNSYPGAGVAEGDNSGVPDYYDRLRDLTVFDAQSMYNYSNQSVDEHDRPERVHVMNVTPSWFRVLQVSPAMGRAFTDEEGEVGREHEVILSDAFWQSAFGGDRSIVGRTIRLDGQPYTVVGIMAKDFVYLRPDVAMWKPLAFTDKQKADSSRHSNSWTNLSRLKPGATVAQAQAQVDALNARNLDRFPQYRQLLINARFHTIVRTLQDQVVRDVKPMLFLLWGGALFVLLIGAVNVANLVLVRSRARLKEMATRIALGADRARIARQLVTESLLLTMTAGGLGLLIGYGALQALGAIDIQDLPRGAGIHLDVVTVVYVLAIAALIGVVLGIIPVFSTLPVNVTATLREEGRTGTAGRGARTLRRALVVAQVAFAFVLLVGSGLLFASFRQVLAIDPGFRPAGVITAAAILPRSGYPDEAAWRRFADEVVTRLRAMPGVVQAGATSTIPLGGDHNDSVILAEGYQMQPGESVISPNSVDVTPGYFEAMGVTLLRGRFFDSRDSADGPKTIIVDERLAKHFWPDQDPIGRRMYKPEDINNLLAVTDKTVFRTVVGVVREVKLDDLVTQQSTVGAYYMPNDQDPSRGLVFVARTNGDPNSIAGEVRGAINSVDRQLAVFDVQPMTERLDKALTARRAPMLLSLLFGAVALFLSAIGIYGVLAYLVTQRTREIGIRIALGSSAGRVVELVMREGVVLVAAGFVLGAFGAIALRRTMASQLVGITPGDPTVLALSVVVLAVVALAACAGPARRATRIDPIVALSE